MLCIAEQKGQCAVLLTLLGFCCIQQIRLLWCYHNLNLTGAKPQTSFQDHSQLVSYTFCSTSGVVSPGSKRAYV